MTVSSGLLILASQRIETVIVDWFGATPTLKKWVATDVTTRRGAPPSLVEWLILAWVFGEWDWPEKRGGRGVSGTRDT